MTEKETGGVLNGIFKAYGYLLSPVCHFEKPKHKSEYSFYNFKHKMLPYAADPIVDPENDARDFHYRFK
jgi:hypothetical protein